MKNKQPVIKFSHEYSKFLRIPENGSLTLPFKGRLLQCFKIHYNELSPRFIDYDAHILSDNSLYPIPKTELIVLVFEISFNRLITTIRRYTSWKWDYYKGSEGDEFEFIKG